MTKKELQLEIGILSADREKEKKEFKKDINELSEKIDALVEYLNVSEVVEKKVVPEEPACCMHQGDNPDHKIILSVYPEHIATTIKYVKKKIKK
jgi:hypothetical protein